jgi:hypothetical protein
MINGQYIVDYFPYFEPTGRELLELRIKMYQDVVDTFVICESNRTQSGTLIKYTLEKTIDELNLPKDKIKIIQLDIPQSEQLQILDIDHHNCYENNSVNLTSLQARVRERMQKDALLSVLSEFPENTIFIHSDSDEFINKNYLPYIVNMVINNKTNVIKIPLVLLEGRADLRVYNKETNEPIMWDGGMFVCTKEHFLVATPSSIRSNVFCPFPIGYITENNKRVEDMGWHFSWMGSGDHRRLKRAHFTHYSDSFSFLESKSYKNDSFEKILKEVPDSGKTPPSGNKNYILKDYPKDKLPQDIFLYPDIENFLFNTQKQRLRPKIDLTTIPVIGTAIVNTTYWVNRLIMSIDYPVEEFIIINNNGRDEITEELNLLTKLKHNYIKKIKICHLPKNIGCSGAWNLIIKSYITSPCWLITNHDISFSPGFLKTLAEKAMHEETGIVFGEKDTNTNFGKWDIFLIKDWVIRECGLFDENFYPAYCEDTDYFLRLSNCIPPIKFDCVNQKYLHGQIDYETTGSQTWRSDLTLSEKLLKAHTLNEQNYLIKKWGPNWSRYQPYKTPFNKKDLPNTYTTFDIDFVREKNLGF